MVIYFIVLFVVIIFLNIGESFSGSKKVNSLFWISLSAILLILFAGIRSSSVGTDTSNYVGIFDDFIYSSNYTYAQASSIDFGYKIVMHISSLIADEYWSLLVIIAAFCVVLSFIVIKKLSANIKISVFLYITLASYLFFFNGARQAIAASVFSIALIYLVKRKIIYYVVWVLIASLFHKTVLVMLPFYFMLNFKFSIKNLIIFSVTSFIAINFISFFLNFFEEDVASRFSVYDTRGAEGGVLLGLFFFIVTFLLIFWRKQMPESILKRYDLYLHFCVFSSLIYLVVITTGKDVNFLRFALYFSMGYILIWPYVLQHVKLFKMGIAKFLFFFVHLLFYYVYLSKMSNLTPYLLNPQLL